MIWEIRSLHQFLWENLLKTFQFKRDRKVGQYVHGYEGNGLEEEKCMKFH